MSVLGMVTSFGTPGRNVRQLAVQIKHSEASLVSVMVIARGARRDRAVCSSRVRLPSPPEPRLSYPVWRQDLLRFLDAFGLDTVALGGWSLGCAVALDVVGKHDAPTPVAMAEDLNKAIPTSFLKIVPNCGHFSSYEQPERVCEVMTTFLEAFGAGRTERVGAR